MPSDWMDNWYDITKGPEYLQSIERYPEFSDDQDFSDAIIEPTLEALGRLVRACSLLEIALFQALSTLDTRVSFTEAEANCKPGGCIRSLRGVATELKPARIRGVRRPVRLETLLDRAEEYLELRHGVVHGRPGRLYMSEVYESRRWVVRRGQEPRLVTTVYDRNRLMLAGTRAANVASDILAGLEEWGAQKNRIRRAQHQALGPVHPLRVENDGSEVGLFHALKNDSSGRTLCGQNATTMEPHILTHGDPSKREQLMFEASNSDYHCKGCHGASGLGSIT